MDLVQKIGNVKRDGSDKPLEPVELIKVEILEVPNETE